MATKTVTSKRRSKRPSRRRSKYKRCQRSRKKRAGRSKRHSRRRSKRRSKCQSRKRRSRRRSKSHKRYYRNESISLETELQFGKQNAACTLMSIAKIRREFRPRQRALEEGAQPTYMDTLLIYLLTFCRSRASPCTFRLEKFRRYLKSWINVARANFVRGQVEELTHMPAPNVPSDELTNLIHELIRNKMVKIVPQPGQHLMLPFASDTARWSAAWRAAPARRASATATT